MGKYIRIILLAMIDAFLVAGALMGSVLLRFDGVFPENLLVGFSKFTPIFVFVALVIFFAFGLYRRIWEYASIGELASVVAAVTVAMGINTLIFYMMSPDATGVMGRLLGGVWVLDGVKSGYILPRSTLIISWILIIALVGGSRLAWRLFRDYTFQVRKNKLVDPDAKRVLVYGAGDAGAILAKEMKSHYSGASLMLGFLDDDGAKHGAKLLGYEVYGGREVLADVADRLAIDEVILAMPSAEGRVIAGIIELCQEAGVEAKILPGMYDLIEGNVTVSQVREVKIEDLLGRDPVKVDLDAISGYLEGKVVLVTGAGGSIGSELCRQICLYSPQLLLILDSAENNVYEIEMELHESYGEILVPLVKDVREAGIMDEICATWRPNVVFHAAAHKHVPLMEQNPEEAIKNNVIGTYNVARAARNCGADKFVLVSTDKAVNPTSVMGASKRLAEMVIQELDKGSETSFVAVRFGNVLGSRGSVVPLFKKQIAAGGPVTVTDAQMIRYFMTIPESVQLIIQAGAMAAGGEIFVLDMGEPVRIMDLARSMIKLSGFEPNVDIDIVVTGMRPGEKLYEELLTASEGVNATYHKRIFVGKPDDLESGKLQELMRAMDAGSLMGQLTAGKYGAAVAARQETGQDVNQAATDIGQAGGPAATVQQVVAFLQSFLPDFRRVDYNKLHQDRVQGTKK